MYTASLMPSEFRVKAMRVAEKRKENLTIFRVRAPTTELPENIYAVSMTKVELKVEDGRIWLGRTALQNWPEPVL